MARNGSGVYELLVNSWNPAVDGNAATTNDWQTLIDDVASALTQSVSADGQTPMTGDLNMNGNRVENMANGTTTSDGATLGQIYSQGIEQDVASAATTNIGAINSNFIRITGTTTITSLGTSYNGPKFVRFSAGLTLTHNATTLILPGGANITTAVGDRAIFVPKSNPSNGWNCVVYEYATGGKITGALSIEDNSTSPALKVTQTGTGDVFQAFDAAGDASYFLVSGDGSVGVGVSSVPANTKVIIDRLGNATVPTLAAGTLLTLASAYGTSSDAHLQIIADPNANASIRFGDSATANMARIDYDNIDDTFHAIGNGSFAWSQLADGTLLLAGTTQSLSGASTTAQGYCFPQAGSAAVMSRSGNPVLSIQRTSSDGSAVLFYRQTTNVGSISVTATATAYNVSSDYRLKPNWQRITESGSFIDSLIPRHGTWSADGSYGAGFYAHELQEVSPSSVTGEKDAVDAEGNPIHQVAFYGSSEIIANIVAELQSLRQRVAELESE